jgi:hypothetical protein
MGGKIYIIDAGIGADISINTTGIITASSFVGNLTGTATGLSGNPSISVTGINASGITTVSAGSTAAPSISPSGDSNTGIFFPSADTINASTGGTSRIIIDSNGNITLTNNFYVPLGSAAAPSISFTGDTNTGIYSPGADTLAISTNGTGRLTIDSSGNINIDSGTVYVDAVNNRFGIGTTGPLDNVAIAANNYSGLTLQTGTLTDRPTLSFRNYAGAGNSAYIQGIGYEIAFGRMNQDYGGHSESVRIDSSGRLLVGTSSAVNVEPFVSAQVYSESRYGYASIYRANDASGPAFYFIKSRGAGAITVVQSGDSLGQIRFQGADGGDYETVGAQIEAQVDGTPGANDMPGRLVFSTTADGASTPTERMRIANQGDIYIHTTNQIPGTGNTNVGAQFERAADGTTLFVSRANNPVLWLNRNSDASLVHFNRSGGTVGYIHVSSTHTTYSTNSDYRLKENVTAVTDGITRLQQLKPSRFNFIADPGKTVDGFIAHEVQTVVPEAITGTKDEVNDKGDPVYQGIDQSKLVPLLTAALQEAIGEIESLKARVAALEST